MYIANILRENGKKKTCYQIVPCICKHLFFPLIIQTNLTNSMGLLCRGKLAGLGSKMMQFCLYFTAVEAANLACLKSSGDFTIDISRWHVRPLK